MWGFREFLLMDSICGTVSGPEIPTNINFYINYFPKLFFCLTLMIDYLEFLSMYVFCAPGQHEKRILYF